MKTIKKTIGLLLVATFIGSSLTSCATSSAVQDSSNQVAGYTLKNKTELMQQKIAYKKSKTVLTTP